MTNKRKIDFTEIWKEKGESKVYKQKDLLRKPL